MDTDSDSEFPDLVELGKQIKVIARQKTLLSLIKSDDVGSNLSETVSQKRIAKETATKNSSANLKGRVLNDFPDSQLSISISRSKARSKKSCTLSHDSNVPDIEKCNLVSHHGPNSIKSAMSSEIEKGPKNNRGRDREILPRKTSGNKDIGDIESDTKQLTGLSNNIRNKRSPHSQPLNISRKPKLFNDKTQIKTLDHKCLNQQGYSPEEDFWSMSSETDSSIKERHKFNGRGLDKEHNSNQSPKYAGLKSTNLSSPKKIQRIPTLPLEASTDAFWQQEIINQWNDVCSPPKKITPSIRPASERLKSTKSETFLNPSKPPTNLGLKAKEARKLFSENKQSLAESFLVELDHEITQGEISRMAAPTGGVKIEWSKKLNSTAGRANWRRETMKSLNKISGSGNPSVIYKHFATIELAEKVIDDEERLLNVMAHEFCHLANFMISGIRNNPHGKEFKAWAAICTRKFSHRGVHVTTKHSYAIDYKYIWKCEECGGEVKRHSKSVNLVRHRCGICKGHLVQIKPTPRLSVKSCEYQSFVRDNMKKLRQENPESPQKEIMSLIGKRYQEHKASKKKEENKDHENKEDWKDFDADEDDSELIARQLNNLSI